MFLAWNSQLLIDGGGDVAVAISLLEASNLLVLGGASSVRSNDNLGVHDQSLFNPTGPSGMIEAQSHVISVLWYQCWAWICTGLSFRKGIQGCYVGGNRRQKMEVVGQRMEFRTDQERRREKGYSKRA